MRPSLLSVRRTCQPATRTYRGDGGHISRCRYGEHGAADSSFAVSSFSAFGRQFGAANCCPLYVSIFQTLRLISGQGDNGQSGFGLYAKVWF